MPATNTQELVESVVADQLKSAAAAGRAAAIFSPRLVSETYFAWRKLFDEMGEVRVGVHSLARGENDELLVRADKGANAQGAAWVLGDGADARAILDQVAGGQIDTLLVFGDPLDPEDTPILGDEHRAKLGRLIYVGSFLDATARHASLSLPAAAWAEEDGSFVNFEGRVQWTRRARLSRGEGRPGWRVAADVAEKAGVELPGWTSTADVMKTMAENVAEFGGLTDERLGLLGAAPRAAATT